MEGCKTVVMRVTVDMINALATAKDKAAIALVKWINSHDIDNSHMNYLILN